MELDPHDSRRLLSFEERAHKRALKARLNLPRDFLVLDNFRILDPAGCGGMGTVYAAWDERLDRPVALKMVRPDLTATRRSRLAILREARALARMSHPNVVQVYEVGDVDDQVFIAMEYVDGPTLRHWLAQGARSLSEILRIYSAAGHGLAAAHREHLVHCDFKPDNVIVAADDNPRVVDFGLARTTAPRSTPVPDEEHLVRTSDDRQTIADFGTPEYMAPEQRTGTRADHRSDQYSFCVALYEAIYGSLPPRQRGRGPTPPPRDPVGQHMRRVPRRVRRALRRGLSPDPARRFPSMEALLRQLGQDHAPRRRKAALLVLVGVLAGAASPGVFTTFSPTGVACRDASEARDALWTPKVRQRLEHVITTTDVPFAPDTWIRVQHTIERYLERWDDEHETLCPSWRFTPPSDEDHAKVRCLREDLVPVKLLTERLARSDANTVRHAVQLSTLSPSRIGACGQAEGSVSGEHRDRALKLRELLLQAQFDLRMGEFEAARERLQHVLEQAKPQPLQAVRAQASYWLGRLLESQGEYATAERALRRGHRLAQRVHADHVAVDTAVQLVSVVGRRSARYDEALIHADYASGLIERHGSSDTRRAQLLAHRARVLTAMGEYQRAGSAFEQAAELMESDHTDPMALPEILVGHAWTFIHRQQFDTAKTSLARALRLIEARLGPRHPAMLEVLSDLGKLHLLKTEYVDAAEDLNHALDVGVAALGPDHPELVDVHLRLGWSWYRRRDLDRAAGHFETAHRIAKQSFGPDHPKLADTSSRLGTLARARGNLKRAEALHREDLRISQASIGADNPQLVPSLMNLAAVLQDRNQIDQAERHLKRALALIERHLGAKHISTATVLRSLAEVYDLGSDREAALRVQTRLIDLLQSHVRSLSTARGSMSSDLIGPLMKLTSAHRRIGDYDAACRTAIRAASILESGGYVPRKIGPLLGKSHNCRRAGDLTASWEAHRQAAAMLQTQPPKTEFWIPALLFERGKNLEAEGRTAEAVATVQWAKRSAHKTHRRLREQIDAWILAHRSDRDTTR